MPVRLTNKLRLDPAFVEAVRETMAEYGFDGERDFGVTTLLQPPRVAELTRQFEDQISEDVHDKRSAVFGTAFHSIMEKGARKIGGDVELPVIASVDLDGHTYTVGGTPDHVLGDTIKDWKTCKTWKVIQKDFNDWESQLNLYALALRQAGHEINKLQVTAFMLDWTLNAAKRNEELPPIGVVTITLPLWTYDQQVAFAQERVRLHLAARDELPLCTDEEMKRKPDQYAVTKKGSKRASRVFESFGEATEWAAKAEPDTYEIDHRPGEYVRCDKFPCPVRSVCEQYQALKTS